MADCFAKWKIVLAIKSDTNNVLVTVVRMFVCSCWSWTGWRKKNQTHTNSRTRKKRQRVKFEARRSAARVLSVLSSFFLYKFVPFRIVSPYQTSTVCIQVCVILHYWISLFSIFSSFFRSPLYLHIAAIVLLQWNKLHVMESFIFEMLNRMDIKRRIETVRAYKIGLIYLLSQPNRF